MPSRQDFICDYCQKTFTRSDNLTRHRKTHTSQPLQCPYCTYSTFRSDHLRQHLTMYHKICPKGKIEAAKSDVECCQKPKKARYDQTTSDAAEASVGSEANVSLSREHLDKSDPNTIETILNTNRKWIQDFETTRNTRVQDRFNFELTNPTVDKLKDLAMGVFKRQHYAYKMNLSFGYVLFNTVTEEHEYYYASINNRFLPHPMTITNRADVESFAETIAGMDILQHCKEQRSNSKYIVERITNVLFYINKLKDYYIGCYDEALPDYILRKKAIITLTKNPKNGHHYNDNLCLFRCLAMHMYGTKIESRAKEMAESFCKKFNLVWQNFKGMPLEALEMVEDIFKVNVVVYSLEEETCVLTGEKKVVAIKVRESKRTYANTMYVNLYKRHFSYITDTSQYSRRWQCKKCQKLFQTKHNATVHERRCAEATKLSYAQGGFGLKKSLFEKLHENGFEVGKELTFYPYRLAWDMESYAKPTDQENQEAKTQFSKILVPASVSICANFDQYQQPKCFVSTGDTELLISQMLNYMMEISEGAYELLKTRYKDVIAWLNEKIAERDEMKREMTLADLTDERRTELTNQICRYDIFTDLAEELNVWLQRLPTFGFNSSKFDINLIREHMFPYMLKNGIEIQHIIKKGSEYLSITTKRLLLLDIKNFVGPGMSYAKMLKAYDVPMDKSFWPHSWFDSLDKLNHKELTPQEYFWSDMAQQGISDGDYRELQQLWTREKFSCMGDMLRYYNNMDTLPFVHALEKIHSSWKEIGIEAFKSGHFSLPGLSLVLMMQKMEKHTVIPLIKEPEIFNLLKQNIVGGLAVVNRRYHEAGLTLLPNGKPVATILSYDANALYLYALGQKMGTGLYAIWAPYSIEGIASMKWEKSTDKTKIMRWEDIRKTNEQVTFRRERSYKYMDSQLHWLEYTSHITGIHIQHKFNGKEKIIVYSPSHRYAVDGYDVETNTVYQFNGCLWHSHSNCHLDTERDEEIQQQRKDRTKNMEANIRALGYNLCMIWECEWLEQCRRNPEIGAFVDENFGLQCKTNYLSGGDIIAGIRAGKLLGLALVDLEVPFFNTQLLDYYAEFPPVYKNTDIGLEDIGEFMRNYAVDHGLLSKPRRTLVNSYFGREILVTSELLQWYLRHGLVVTRVYKFIEMKGKKCFSKLRTEIAEHRRKADNDPRYKLQADLWKLVGNSCYGKTVTNKNNHKSTEIVLDNAVGKYLNDKRFCKMDPVSELAYEICSDKKKICQDLPISIGFSVYCGAKHHMLVFIYDFLKNFLRDGSYEIVASDTDSVIAAFESPNLDELVKEEKREEYQEVKKDFVVISDDDLRTPGLFKIELQSKGILALCSKTYLAFGEDDETVKTSTKGLSKRTNNFTKQDFLEVIANKTAGGGTNMGLRMHKGQMKEYTQDRDSLSYLYIKREVNSDGVSTRPLTV